MKYFSALADAEFARACFASAGLDFDAMKAAKNTDSIKAAIAAVKPTTDNGEAEKAFAAAKQENDELKGVVAGLETAQTRLVASFGAIGIKDTSSDEKIAEQNKLNVAKAARDMVARSGHPAIDEVIDPNATKSKASAKVDTSKMDAHDRIRADFQSQMGKRARNVGNS